MHGNEDVIQRHGLLRRLGGLLEPIPTADLKSNCKLAQHQLQHICPSFKLLNSINTGQPPFMMHESSVLFAARGMGYALGVRGETRRSGKVESPQRGVTS